MINVFIRNNKTTRRKIIMLRIFSQNKPFLNYQTRTEKNTHTCVLLTLYYTRDKRTLKT